MILVIVIATYRKKGERFKSGFSFFSINKGVNCHSKSSWRLNGAFKLKRSDEDIERVIQRLIEYEVITRESRITSCASIREKTPLLSIDVGRERGYDFVVYTEPEMIEAGLLGQWGGVYYNVSLREGKEPKYEVDRKKGGRSVKRIAYSETIDEKFIYPVKHDFVEEIDLIVENTKI